MMSSLKLRTRLLILVLGLLLTICTISQPVYAGEQYSSKQPQSLAKLLASESHDDLVNEAILLYGLIDWQEAEINKGLAKIKVRDEALKDCDGSCGFPVTEVIVSFLVGALIIEVID